MTIGEDGFSVCGRLEDHPQYEKWKDEMAPGELWSLFGEKWLLQGVADGEQAILRRPRGPGRLRHGHRARRSSTDRGDRLARREPARLATTMDRRGSTGRTVDVDIDPIRAQELGIKVHGHFNGEPGLPNTWAARRALAYVLSRHEDEAVDAILLIRDMDDQAERRQGLEQGRATFSSITRIVIGLAIPERECWGPRWLRAERRGREGETCGGNPEPRI